MYKCKNCKWEGEEPVRNKEARLDFKCPICGDETEQVGVVETKKEEKINLDANNDGVIDEKDASIFGKGLKEVGKAIKSKKVRGKR